MSKKKKLAKINKAASEKIPDLLMIRNLRNFEKFDLIS
jgi:hypothetical protein